MKSETEPQSLALLVDSDAGCLQLLERSLALCNFRTKSCVTADEAIDFLQAKRPSLIVADIKMIGQDGRSLRDGLLTIDPQRAIPTIILARWQEMVEKVNDLKEDIDSYLVKPFLSVELIATVRNLLRSARHRQMAREIDPLTRTYNRTFLERRAPILLKEATSTRQPVACALIDIDHLKKVNELYGTETGDLVLRAVARIIKKNIRKEDVVIRYRGEEFLIFLPNQEADAAFVVIDRIRRIIASRIFTDMSRKHHFQLTISSGLNRASQDQPLEEIIAEADMTMAYAKKNGRNQTCVLWEDNTPHPTPPPL